MEQLLNPHVLELLFTLAVGSTIVSSAILTLYALPWTDKDIRSVDKTLNPIDVTQEGIPLPTLSRA